MDPIGFALESFDAIGRWRTMDGATPIDPSSVMYDGTEIHGAADLRDFLLEVHGAIRAQRPRRSS